MLKTSRGLVLSTLKYNDEFIIADVFTQTDGRVSFMVRVPKSSRQRGALRLFQPLIAYTAGCIHPGPCSTP